MPAPTRSNNNIPPDTIRLSEVFDIFYRTTVHNGQVLVDEQIAKRDEYSANAMPAADERAVDAATRDAERAFRCHLASGNPTAMIRDPATGDRLTLDRRGWADRENFGIPGFHEDYVWSGDLMQPGPDAMIDWVLYPVFFDREKFDAFLQTLKSETDYKAGTQKVKRGAKPRYDWPDAEEYGLTVMRENGDFRPWDTDAKWKAKADLINLMVLYMGKHGGEPALSSVKVHANAVYSRWQAEQAAKDTANK